MPEILKSKGNCGRKLKKSTLIQNGKLSIIFESLAAFATNDTLYCGLSCQNVFSFNETQVALWKTITAAFT